MALCDTIDHNGDCISDVTAITTSPLSKTSLKDQPVAQPTRTPQSNHQQQQPQPLLFPRKCLDYDHYNGVTIDLESINDDYSLTFEKRLKQQLQIWKAEGRIRGVWIHIPPQLAAHVPTCIDNGFSFHMVSPSSIPANCHSEEMIVNDQMTSNNRSVLILSQWLPDSPSRLPVGPTHQVGVGCLVWHPADSPLLGKQRRLLVVQEKSGPAATFQLWKLPTGLTDPNEDVHAAAMRELYEETGLIGTFNGLLLVRQAHPTVITTTTKLATPVRVETSEKDDRTEQKVKKISVQRKASDLFFICQMTLQQAEPSSDDKDNPIWTACPNEIAAIQWMPVEEYCSQRRWQSSPLYMELNRVILESASASTVCPTNNTTKQTAAALWNDTTLPVWVDENATTAKDISAYRNTFYSVK